MTFSESAVDAAARAAFPYFDEMSKVAQDEALAEARNMLTAALAVDGMALQRWKSIESAPADTGVIVSVGIISCEARLHEDGNWYVANNDSTDSWGGPIYPTHWQPMPLAAILTAASDGEVG